MAQPDKLPQPNLNEIAAITDGRDLTRNLWLAPLLDPQDSVLMGKGRGDLLLYEEVLRDDQVKACLQQRIDAVTSCAWGVEPGGNKRIDIKAAEFIKQQMHSLQWDNICAKMLYGTFYGFSIAECMYANEGGLVIFANSIDSEEGKGIRVRNRRRFKFDQQQRPRLITLRDMWEGEILPERKFWKFSVGGDNDDDPYGRGLAHWLYWPVFFKRSDIRFWLVFLEKFGMPTAKVTYPVGTSKEDQDKMLQVASQLMAQAAVKMPEGMMLELVEASRSGAADYQALHDVMNAAISKIILSGTMTTDSGSSLSQAEVHDTVKRSIIRSDARLLNESFQAGPVRWLVDWNFPGAAYPRITRQTDPEPDKKASAETDKVLVDMGNTLKREYLTETYGDRFDWPDDSADAGPPPLATGKVESLTTLLSGAVRDKWTGGLVRAMLKAAIPELPDGTIDAVAVEIDKMMAGGGTDGGAPVGPAVAPGETDPAATAAVPTIEPEDPSIEAALAAFAEGRWSGGAIEFASTAKKCTKGLSCGTTCISAAKTCSLVLTPEQAAQHKALIGKVMGKVMGPEAPPAKAAKKATKAESKEPKVKVDPEKAKVKKGQATVDKILIENDGLDRFALINGIRVEIWKGKRDDEMIAQGFVRISHPDLDKLGNHWGRLDEINAAKEASAKTVKKAAKAEKPKAETKSKKAEKAKVKETKSKPEDKPKVKDLMTGDAPKTQEWEKVVTRKAKPIDRSKIPPTDKLLPKEDPYDPSLSLYKTIGGGKTNIQKTEKVYDGVVVGVSNSRIFNARELLASRKGRSEDDFIAALVEHYEQMMDTRTYQDTSPYALRANYDTMRLWDTLSPEGKRKMALEYPKGHPNPVLERGLAEFRPTKEDLEREAREEEERYNANKIRKAAERAAAAKKAAKKDDDDDVWDFSEPNFGTAKKCVKGLSCGTTCIAVSKTCELFLTPEQAAQHKALIGKVMGKVMGPLEAPTGSTPKKTEYAQKWEGAWGNSPDDLKTTLGKIDQPDEVNENRTGGAYHIPGKIYMAEYTPGADRADGVWRHEYGHHLDEAIPRLLLKRQFDQELQALGVPGGAVEFSKINKGPDQRRALDLRTKLAEKFGAKETDLASIGKAARKKMFGSTGYISDSDQINDALRADEESLLRSDGYGALQAEAKKHIKDLQKVRTVAKAIEAREPPHIIARKVMQAQAYREANDKAWEEVSKGGFKEDPRPAIAAKTRENLEARADSLAAASLQGEKTTAIDLYRSLSSYQRGKLSPGELAAIIGDPQDPFMKTRLAGVLLGAEMKGIAEDLAGAITLNKVGRGHDEEYYAKRGLAGQNTESFANIIAIYGSGNKSAELVLQAIAPKAFAETKKILKRVNDG